MPLPLRHRICAHPLAISWVLGALALWIVATAGLSREGVLPAAFTELSSVLWLLLGYACLGGLGFFAGAFSVLWLVIRICRRLNGAPFEVGDRVLVLTGPATGTVSRVYELTRGQGGTPLVAVELGAKMAGRYRDLFDEFALLRLPRDGPADSNAHGISAAGKPAADSG